MPLSKSSEPYSFEAWCQKELSKLLEFPVGDDLVSYLLSMQSEKDIKEYLTEILGGDTPALREFQQEFMLRWHPPERLPSVPSVEEQQLLEPLVRQRQEEMVLFADRKGGGEGGGSGGEGGGKGKQQLLEPLVRPRQEEMVLFADRKGGGERGGSGGEGGGKGKDRKKEGSGELTAPPGFSAIHAAKLDDPSSILSRGRQSMAAAGKDTTSERRKGGRGLGRKEKFVPLMSQEGQSRMTPQLPGRHPCQCLAQRHTLVNNCIDCGRIVCAQEGSGPCLFCGTLVCTPEEEEMLARDSKKGHKMREQLLKQFEMKDGERAFDHLRKVEASKGLSKAVQHKDKLVEFDKTSVHRTKVLDDELDYFSVDSNRWLTEEQRDALRKKEEELREIKYGSRRNKPVTLDFAGRRVVEEDSKMEIYDEQHVRDLVGGERDNGVCGTETHTAILYNPSIPVDPPKYQETQPQQKRLKPWPSLSAHKDSSDQGERPSIVRVQDRALQEMKDEGKCLSMHQPWASLLVAGIKRSEGRTWYTTHRGRLWIAATVKKPDPEEIRENEEFYRRLYGEKELRFPANYPVGCLLGCVDMIDCLSQEEYREQFPEGESESPYVFTVENPQQLIVKFPVKGQHKIWTIPHDIHTAAKRGCKPART